MMLQAAAPAVAEKAVSFVGEFILGGIAIFAIGIAYWVILQWKKKHDEHVADLKIASNQHVEMHKAYQASSAEVVGAINRLTETEKAQTVAIQSSTTELSATRVELASYRSSLDSMNRRIDEVIIRDRRRTSTDRMPRIKEGEER